MYSAMISRRGASKVPGDLRRPLQPSIRPLDYRDVGKELRPMKTRDETSDISVGVDGERYVQMRIFDLIPH